MQSAHKPTTSEYISSISQIATAVLALSDPGFGRVKVMLTGPEVHCWSLSVWPPLPEPAATGPVPLCFWECILRLLLVLLHRK